MLIRDINSLKFSSKDSGSPVDADAGYLHQHPEVNLITLQVTLLLERVGESRDL